MTKKVLNLLLVIFCLNLVLVQAKEIPTKPNPPKLVNDYANALSAQQKEALEYKLVKYFDSTSTQIVVVIEPSIENDDIFDYSYRFAQAWGIGEKGKNNGLLIYVALNDRKIRIQTGYGMEGVIPDAYAKRIIDNNIKPNFKQQNYYQGLDEAVDIIIKAAAGEYVYDRKGGKKGGKLPGFVVVLIIILVLILISKGGGKGGMRMLRGPMWYGTFGGGGFSGGNSWGGGSSGGGGGFGGFGGGSFGGGGAGGSW